MKRVMVTGAAGFVGAAVCHSLVAAGYPVIGVVRSLKKSVPGVDYLIADLLEEKPFGECFPEVDCIIHLAGRAHVLKDQVTDPLALFRGANRDATLRLASQALKAGVSRFIFVSSIGVNGNETKSSAFSELNIPAPHAAYALSKLEAENGLSTLCSDTGMGLVILRPPLIYGAEAPGNFARLLKLVDMGLPLPLGAVRNQRSLLSLANMVDFLKLSIEHPKAVNELFLLSDGTDVSTAQMIRLMAVGMGRKTLLLPIPPTLLKWFMRVAGKKSLYSQLCCSLQVNSNKTRELLGWTPPNNTIEELKEVARLYQERKST